MKKKVLFVITKSNWGGAQRYLFDLATSLPKDRFDAVVAFGGSGARGAAEGELARKLQASGVRTIFVRAFARDIGLADVAALRELKRIFRAERPEVVHLNSSKAGGLGALAARLAGIPTIVFTSHGLAWDEDRGAFARAAIGLATWLTFLLSTAVITISKDNCERARRLPFCRNKVHLIYNGLPLLRFALREDARRKLAAQAGVSGIEEDLWIGTVAELTRNKGLSYLVDAAKLLVEKGKSFQLFILGEGEERARLEAQVRAANLSNRVHLLGFVSDAYEHLSAFDIFALASVKEGLPYVLMEAGQAGCALVGTNIPGINDVLQGGTAGLLARPKDSADISEKLLRLVEREDECNALGQAAKENMAERFSLARMVEATIKLYER